MGRVGGKPAQFGKGVFQPPQGGVKDGGQLAQFIVGVRHREPSAQRLRGDLPGARHHLGHRRKGASGDEVTARGRERHGRGQPEREHGADFRQGAPKLRLGPKDPQEGRLADNPRRPFQDADVEVALQLRREGREGSLPMPGRGPGFSVNRRPFPQLQGTGG